MFILPRPSVSAPRHGERSCFVPLQNKGISLPDGAQMPNHPPLVTEERDLKHDSLARFSGDYKDFRRFGYVAAYTYFLRHTQKAARPPGTRGLYIRLRKYKAGIAQ